MNQFIAIAVAEKLGALNTEQFFAERREQGDTLLFRELLTLSGGEPVQDGDGVPN